MCEENNLTTIPNPHWPTKHWKDIACMLREFTFWNAYFAGKPNAFEIAFIFVLGVQWHEHNYQLTLTIINGGEIVTIFLFSSFNVCFIHKQIASCFFFPRCSPTANENHAIKWDFFLSHDKWRNNNNNRFQWFRPKMRA